MKQNLIIKCTLLIFTALLSFNGFSQNSIEASKLTEEWTLLATKDGVEVYLKQEKCDMGAKDLFTYAYIRLINNNTVEKTIEFNFLINFDNRCVGCEDTRETKKMLAVSASTIVDGGCSSEIGELALLINNPYQIESGVFQSITLDVLNIK